MKESVMEFPAVALSVCCSFVAGVGVTVALLLLLCCWCAAVGPVLNFSVFCALLRSGVVFACSCLTQVDHLRSPSMVASGTARLDVVLLRPSPCHCCSYRSPREWQRALPARLDVVSSRAIPYHCCRWRSMLPESSSRLLWRRAILRGWTLVVETNSMPLLQISLAVIVVGKSIAIVLNQVWRFWR